MPERKKPSRASTSKSASARTSSRQPVAKKAAAKTSKKAAAKKPAAVKRAPAKGAAKKPASKPAAKRTGAKRGIDPELLDPLDLEGLALDEDLEEEGTSVGWADGDDDDEADGDDDSEGDSDGPDVGGSPREVAIAPGPFVLEGETDVAQPLLVRFDDREIPAEREPGTGEVERPREELLAGAAAFVLTFSVFLSWFGQTGLPITGWEGGIWGPVIFFTSLAVVAIVALRRFGVPLALPVDHSAIIEAVGWLAVLGALASRLFGAEVNGTDFPATTWVFVPIVAGVALALLASKISTGSPFVLKPGWFDGTGGKIGASILAVALLGGLGFGVTGEATPGRGTARRETPVKQFQGKLPPCATAVKFPTPPSVKLALSFQLPEDNCNVTFTSTATLKKLTADFRAALKAAGWKFVATPSPKAMTFQLTAPRCGTLSLNEIGQTAGSGKTPAPRITARITGFAVFSKTCTISTARSTTGRLDQPTN